MDNRAQAIFRLYKACPEDPQLREAAEGILERFFVEPEARFQSDLREGGPLERALRWAMELSRISVQTKARGGLLSCGETYGKLDTHVRIWYPTREDLLLDCLMDDVRFTVSASRYFSELVESLEERFPGATIMSVQAANASPAKGHYGYGFVKPARADQINRKALAACVAAEGSTRGRVAGRSTWVA
jgi:hypothetical protein